MITDATAVAEKLLQADAVRLRPEAPFTWASGWKSPIYCDNRRVLGFPYIRDFIKSEMCNVVFGHFADAEALAGVATAGIAWGAMAADQLKLPFLYVRPKPKDHGMGNQIEGYFEAGKKVVVIEDLVSTGKSSLQAVNALRAAGIEILGMVAIFSYGFAVANEAFAKAEVELVTLTNYSSLVELSISKGSIANNMLDTLTAWRNDPANWQGV
jgi:orotate phosphoribosyltransferase